MDIAALCMSAPAGAAIPLPFTNGAEQIYTAMPADDTRIQAIVNAAAAGHHLAYIPAGVYTLNNAITFPADHIQIYGNGPSTVFINNVPDAAGTGYAFDINGRTGIAIRNCTILETPAVSGHHISLNAAHRVLIDGVEFTHTTANRACIHPHDNATRYARIFSCIFNNSGNVDYAVDNFGFLFYSILAKNFFNCADNASALFEGTGGVGLYTVIKDNIFGDPSGNVVYQIDFTGLDRLVICDNHRCGTFLGFATLTNCDWVSIFGNTDDSTLAINPLFLLTNCEDCAVTGNVCQFGSAVSFVNCTDCTSYGNHAGNTVAFTGTGNIEMGNQPVGFP